MARLFSARTLVLGGLAVAAGAAALKNRGKVAGLIGARSSTPEPYPSPAEAPVGTPAAAPGPSPAPEVSNFDAAGPPENTATHVPAPEPFVHDEAGGIDEDAEEAAAAAEAANIGGPRPEYPGEDDPDAQATEAERALEEAGEGYAEGEELTEADLIENAEDEDSEGERAIDEAIEAQDNPYEGERLEALERSEPEPTEAPDPDDRVSGIAPPLPPRDEAGSEAQAEPKAQAEPEPEPEPGAASGETPAAEKSANVWRSDASDEQPTVEQPKLATDEASEDDDGGNEWQTWSGRAVEP